MSSHRRLSARLAYSRRTMNTLTLSVAALALALQSVPGPHLPATRARARGPMNVLVPAYFYPVTSSPWGRLTAKAAQHPGRVWAIGDPFNGPGPSFDPVYAQTFATFRQAGGKLIGYVSTSYATVPLAQARADIDQWLAWYPLDGFFLDEMENTPGAHEAYYQSLRQYALSRLPHALVVANPGTSAPASYLFTNGSAVVDSLCIFENLGTGFPGWQPDAWVRAERDRHFYALPYGVGAAQWTAAVDHAHASNCGWVYVTDDVLPNPWDTLPPYFEALVDDVVAR